MNISKPHPNIQIRTSISINLSASQWKLKIESYPRVIVEKVADFLNKRVTYEFNKGESRQKIIDSFDTLAKNFEIYGATSKETKAVFNGIINTVLPEGAK